MKILYGVQGTGNGHLTRARVMAKALQEAGAQVDWVFSGRPKEKFFDMEIFGDFQCYRGMTFAVKRGGVQTGKTVLQSNLWRLYQDVRQLNVEGYDLYINDFEPVSAWAAKRAGKKVIGLSHQSAFLYDIPKRGDSFIIQQFMRHFAPCGLPIGLHWHHFDQPILPPIVETRHPDEKLIDKQVLVYLPFADLEDVLPLLQGFADYQFYVYRPVERAEDLGHIHIRPFSRDDFQRDLLRSEGVIASAGFELASEAIEMGKKLLVQPMAGQMEQQSNAMALERLGYGLAADELTPDIIAQWLPLPPPAPVSFPDVARALTHWLLDGAHDLESLRDQLWSRIPTPAEPRPNFGILSDCA